MTSISFFLAGAPVAYRSRYQKIVLLSSTKSEFIAASEAGKLALYLRSILSQLDNTQNNDTVLYKDNAAAVTMANAQRLQGARDT